MLPFLPQIPLQPYRPLVSTISEAPVASNVIVVVEIKVKYRMKNTPQNPVWCQQVGGIMGAGKECLLE